MTETTTQKDERRAFVLLVVFLGPILAVAIVGSYGLIVWISQVLLEAPGA